ncbi:MAG: MBL fold metallo-hydrolase [Flavobacteriaceae bacterium]|nr:MAG: MBL fold metallo-hydrolase [Flavobacteriales bacterium]
MRFKFIIISFFLITFQAKSQTDYDIKILGVAQDGGVPHLGCSKTCCSTSSVTRYVSSIMVSNQKSKASYIFDASPDLAKQLSFMKDKISENLKGIFLTHAHIGHYSGLMYFGRESFNSKNIPVYAMPRMKKFLETNGPWDQLVSLNNIKINSIINESEITVEKDLVVKPIEVPHRDEYSETVGYIIKGPNRSAIYIPDIDKWYKWDKSIVDLISSVDYAFIDATFYDEKEINYRDISEIPHPFVIESMKLFEGVSKEEKSKIYFIHLNHTNPLLDSNSSEYKDLISRGYNVAQEGLVLKL